jgi:hypothetical protein
MIEYQESLQEIDNAVVEPIERAAEAAALDFSNFFNFIDGFFPYRNILSIFATCRKETQKNVFLPLLFKRSAKALKKFIVSTLGISCVDKVGSDWRISARRFTAITDTIGCV